MQARSTGSRFGRTVLVLLVVLAALLPIRTAWVAYGPSPSRLAGAQVDFLTGSLERGADQDMQRLFPEGAFFLTALTASAAAATDRDPTAARALRDRLERPALLDPFGRGMVPEHGIFAAGWSLATAVDVATETRDAEDFARVEEQALIVGSALRTAPSPFLAGYPGQYWPCDTVVAAASLARAAALLDRPDWLAVVRTWRAAALALLDPDTGLLPHRVDADGRAIEGSRGSSQSIIQAFWPQLSAAMGEPPDLVTWQRFRAAFVTRVGGLVGVREHPVGQDGVGDVDSGPLMFGVSLSASAVTLGAARAIGDRALAADLDRQAELVGVPVWLPGGRRFAGGVLPVGDAFVAWARTRSEGAAEPTTSPRTVWWVWVGFAALPAGLLIGLGAVLGARRRAGAGVRAR